MRYFPLFLDLDAAVVTLVGGGEAAAQKARLLAKTAACLRVVAPQPTDELVALARAGRIALETRPFADSDLDHARLVIVADPDPELRARVAASARRRGVLVNVVDDASLSDVLVPAIVDRDPIVVAIGSEGTAPALARRVRERVEAMLPERIGHLARFAAGLRRRVARRLPAGAPRRQFWEQLFDGPAAALVLAGQEAEAQRLAERALARPQPAPGTVALLVVAADDPDLLTLGALGRLQRADLLVADADIPDRILERARRDAERIVRCHEPGCAPTDGDELLAGMARVAASGRSVVRLTRSHVRAEIERRALAEAGITASVLPATASLERQTETGPHLPTGLVDHQGEALQ